MMALLLVVVVLLLLLSLQLLCTRRAGTSRSLRLAHWRVHLRGMGWVCFWGLSHMLAGDRSAKRQGRRASNGNAGGDWTESTT